MRKKRRIDPILPANYLLISQIAVWLASRPVGSPLGQSSIALRRERRKQRRLFLVVLLVQSHHLLQDYFFR